MKQNLLRVCSKWWSNTPWIGGSSTFDCPFWFAIEVILPCTSDILAIKCYQLVSFCVLMGWSCHFHSFKVIFDYFLNLSQHHRCWQKTVLGVPTENWSLHPVSGEGTEAESGIWRATQAPTGFYLENHIQQSKQCRHCCIFKVFHLFSAALFHLLASGCWLAHVELSWSHCEAARYGFVWRAPMGTPSSKGLPAYLSMFHFWIARPIH